MHWFLVFSISAIALDGSSVRVSSLISSHLHTNTTPCNWNVIINCNELVIDISNVTIVTYICNSDNCNCAPHGQRDTGTYTDGNINQTIYDECQNQTCNATLPHPTNVGTNATRVTIYYTCKDGPIATTSTSQSTETASSGQETTNSVNDPSTFTATHIQSSSSSSSVAPTTQMNTPTETADEKSTQSTITFATSANDGSTSTFPTSVGHGTGASTEDAENEQTTGSVKYTTSDHIVNRKDLRKRKTLLTAVSATVPLVIALVVITISAIICIRRKRRGHYTGDKTAVLSVSRTASTTDSSDDDNAESHPNQARTSHSNSTTGQHGGYNIGDYSDIDTPEHTNDTSEYNTIDLKTFKIVTADPTYNHIGHSLNYDATTASPYGEPKMAEDADASYATCGETETVFMDNIYSHTNQGYLENNQSNAKVLAEISNYDHIDSFRDGTEAAVDDTYSHIGAEADDSRGKSNVKYVDNYSHVSHVTNSGDGTEPRMQIMDDNADSVGEGAQALQAVADDERDDTPDVGNNSDSEIKDHEYFILEKQF